MKTLAELRAVVWDLLDSDENDDFFPASRVDDALNTALAGAAARLGATNARRRYQKKVADLSADAGFDAAALSWALPADFLRPVSLKRRGFPLHEVKDSEDFSTYGADGYEVVGRTLYLTEGTDASGLEVRYVYAPARMTANDSTPDWIEGHEEYLALRAAALLIRKGDTGDPTTMLDQANMLWPDVVIAARQSSLPGEITSPRGAYMEEWY